MTMRPSRLLKVFVFSLLLAGCTESPVSSSSSIPQSEAFSSGDSSEPFSGEEPASSTGEGSLPISASDSNNGSVSSDTSSSMENPIPEDFSVEVEENPGVEISGLKPAYRHGEEVSFSLRVVAEGKMVGEVKANENALSPKEDGIYSFSMPKENVILRVRLTDKASETKLATSYRIAYDLGAGKQAKKLADSDAVYNCFVKQDEEESLIASVSSFDSLYGGANGRNESVWYAGDILKFGTTSVNGSLTLSLKKPVKGINIVGYTYSKTSKIRVGDGDSSDWNGGGDGETKLAVCSEMTEICKSAVDNASVSSLDLEFSPTSSLTIATTNKNPLFITALNFVLAEGEKTDEGKKFTVTWNNYDGTSLEVDEDVSEGSVPHYDGATPIKPKEGETSYRFIGWDPEITPVKENATYTAQFKEIIQADPSLEDLPTLSLDGASVEYGYYPQTRVEDPLLVERLESALEISSGGWSVLDGEAYVKIAASAYQNESYVFDNGASIENGKEYWFRCDKIVWKILGQDNGEFLLLSEKLLDNGCFYKDYEGRIVSGKSVLPNSYLYSEAREWLNGSFLKAAFQFGSSYLLEAETTGDKVELLGLEDYANSDYGFAAETTSSTTRQAKTTDFARARGAWYNKGEKNSSLLYNGSYWTKTASEEFDYAAKNVNSSGFISDYAVDGASHCYRPSIRIRL